MKLSELKPCEKCGGPVAPVFYKVTIEQHFIDPRAVNEVLGLNQMFGGNALGLAEVMSARGDDATKTLTVKAAVVCQECAFMSHLLPWLFDHQEEAT